MPRARSASKPSSVAKKAVVKAGSPTPTKRKVSAKKTKQAEEDPIPISSDSGDEKVQVETPTKNRDRKAKKAKLSEEETPTRKTPKGRKSVKVESDDEVKIVSSPVKRKASANNPPSPGTAEYKMLEPITFAKGLTIPSTKRRQAVEDEEKPSKRIRVEGNPRSDQSSKEIVFGTTGRKVSGLKRKRVQSSEDEGSQSELEEEVSDNSRIRRAESQAASKAMSKSVFVHDEAVEADEEEEDDDEEETSVVEESIEEIVAESVESATESLPESGEVKRVVKVDKKGKGKQVEAVKKVQVKDGKDNGKAKEESTPENSDLEDEDFIVQDKEPITAPIEEEKVDKGKPKENKTGVSQTPDVPQKRFKPDPSRNVMNEDFMDPQLMETYKNLPWVNKAELLAYGTSRDSPELVNFRDWEGMIEPYRPEVIKMWLTFQRSGRYVNASRADPEDFAETKPLSKEPSYLCLHNILHSTCVAVSVIQVQACYLFTPKQTQKSTIRRIDGVMHNIEMDRFMGFAGMIWNFESLSSNMFRWTLSFEARRQPLESSQSAPSSPSKVSSFASPSKLSREPKINFRVRREKPDSEAEDEGQIKAKARAQEGVGAESRTPAGKPDPMMAPFKKRLLDFHDDIPIYDGRNKKLDPNKQMHKLSALPLYGKDLPKGSLAVVGYTMCTHYPFKPDNKQMSYNVQWVVLLALPLNV